MFSSLVITDGGLETTLIYQEKRVLPEFAAFLLLKEDSGRELLGSYFRNYLAIAAEHQLPFLLGTPTWRANRDWGLKVGCGADELEWLNRMAVSEMKSLQSEYKHHVPETYVSGCIGPRGDGYKPSEFMHANQAEQYHETQVRVLAESGVDLVTAMTLNGVSEAIGIVRAAVKIGIPVAISFTLETNGRLASGKSLKAAIEETDKATQSAAAYFMVNCAHPTHFDHIFDEKGDWMQRMGGLRCNASRLSHAALDVSEELDAGDPMDLARRMHALKDQLPHLLVMGGCCGTDCSHIHAIAHGLIGVKEDQETKDLDLNRMDM